MKSKYSLIIRWSKTDNCFIAWIPEFGPGIKRHADSYETAARAGVELIDEMIERCDEGEVHRPDPWDYDSSDDIAVGQFLFPNGFFYRSWPKRNTAAVKEPAHA